MKNNTTLLEETKINISVRTGVMHKDKADEIQTQIDFTGYYISTISYFVRVALEAQSHLNMQTDSIVFENDAQFRENLQFAAQLIEAFTEMLPDYSSDLVKYSIAKTETPTVLDLPEKSNDDRNLNKLAAQISEVLKNPDLPVAIYNAILHGTDEIINTSSSEANGNYETSPEHIKAVLKICSNE